MSNNNNNNNYNNNINIIIIIKLHIKNNNKTEYLLLGPLCYKLITIVNCYLETGLTCFVYYPKALYLIIFIVWHPF